MEIHRITFERAELASLSEAERRLLILLGHAANEINIFSKLLLMIARKGKPPSSIADSVESGQATAIMRVLIGKLHEAWELFKKRVQADANVRGYTSELDSTASAAVERLNRHFSKSSPLTAIRNEVAFHYWDEHGLAEKSFHAMPPSEPLEFFLVNPTGNAFYHASEVIMFNAALEFCKKSPTDTELQAFSRLCDVTISVARDISEIFSQVMGIIITNKLPNVEAVVEQHPDGPRLSTLELPYFIEYDEPR